MAIGQGIRATSQTHPGYRLTAPERVHVAMLVEMGLWTQTAIAKAYEVSRRTVADCHRRVYG